MSKKKKEYKTKKKRPLSLWLFKGFLKILIRKPETIIADGAELSEKAIYIMNHCGARGPMIFEMYFPVRANPWGAHEMCGKYKERWNYLYHVFYRQKLHWGKFNSFVVATLFAFFQKWLYNSVALIGTYTDMRMMEALRKSFAVFEDGMSVVIFPEDSTNGYAEVAEDFHKGFLSLSKIYYKRTKEDLPVYSVYYARKKRLFVVDKPMYVNAMLNEGKSEDEVLKIFLDSEHRLYNDYVADGNV